MYVYWKLEQPFETLSLSKCFPVLCDLMRSWCVQKQISSDVTNLAFSIKFKLKLLIKNTSVSVSLLHYEKIFSQTLPLSDQMD